MTNSTIPTFIKILNLACSLAVIAGCAYNLVVQKSGKSSEAVLAMYYLIFAILIAISEFENKVIVELFLFMRGPVGKGSFLIFCGSLFLQKKFNFMDVVGAALILVGLLNIIFMSWLRRPSTEPKPVAQKQYSSIRGDSKAHLPDDTEGGIKMVVL